MKRFLILVCAATLTLQGSAQLMMTRSGIISFHSHTILEDIDAENKQVMAVIDAGKKSIAFSCMMKQFIFPRKLMQQHFNENYVESEKFPKATFSGSYTEDVDLEKNGVYPVSIRGRLTIHGVTRDINVPARLEVSNGKVTGTTTFKLNPTDYNISIPFIVRDKIEKENTVKVKVEWTLKN
jgi:polyisoprenoid-binding protein YceI